MQWLVSLLACYFALPWELIENRSLIRRQASDYSVIDGVLGTVNLIFKKFRYDLLIDFGVLFATPLLEIFSKPPP